MDGCWGLNTETDLFRIRLILRPKHGEKMEKRSGFGPDNSLWTAGVLERPEIKTAAVTVIHRVAAAENVTGGKLASLKPTKKTKPRHGGSRAAGR